MNQLISGFFSVFHDFNDLSVNEMAMALVEIIQKSKELSTTSREMKLRKKTSLCPWFNDEMKRLSNSKRNLLQLRRRRPNDVSLDNRIKE